MTKLQKLVVGTYLGPFVLTFFIVLFILVMQFLWKYIDELVGKGLEWSVIGEMIFYASASLVPLALPLAVLLSAIMTFGNLGEHYELVALKSAGLSLLQIMRPLIIFIVFVALGAFYFSNNILPLANLKSASLLYDIRHKKPAIDINDRIFYKEIDGFVIRVERNDRKENRLYDVLIYDHRDKKGNVKVIRAKEGEMSFSADNRYLVFALYDGYSYTEMEGRKAPHLKSNFKEDIIRFDLSEFAFSRTDEELFKDGYRMMNLLQLRDGVDTLRKEKRQLSETLYERFVSGHRFLGDTIRQVKPTPLTDSLIATGYPLSTFTRDQQDAIYNNALAQLRRNKALLNSSEKIVEGKDLMIRKFRIEWHRKLVLSIACIVLFFVGAPLGAIIRKGGLGLPVIVSVLFFLVFHVISITGEKMIKSGSMEVFTGMWMATSVLLPIGIFLTYKATNDAALLDRDAYARWVDSLKKRFVKSAAL